MTIGCGVSDQFWNGKLSKCISDWDHLILELEHCWFPYEFFHTLPNKYCQWITLNDCRAKYSTLQFCWLARFAISDWVGHVFTHKWNDVKNNTCYAMPTLNIMSWCARVSCEFSEMMDSHILYSFDMCIDTEASWIDEKDQFLVIFILFFHSSVQQFLIIMFRREEIVQAFRSSSIKWTFR